MITVKGDKNPLFILDTGHTTYAMKVLDTGHIEHLYYGRKIHMDDADGLTEQHEFAPGTTSVYSPGSKSIWQLMRFLILMSTSPSFISSAVLVMTTVAGYPQ